MDIARTFFELAINREASIKARFDAIMKAKNLKLSEQEKAVRAVKTIIGDGSQSGIYSYQTNDKNKQNFTKL